MAAASQAPLVHETLADMDSHIARLKDKAEEQRKSLQHWQTWDAEYEALKEEVQALTESPTVEELHQIRNGFDGEFLVGKELDEIFGQQQRSRDQIVNVLDRRIDYVGQNVRSLQTQLEKIELEIMDADASNEQGAVDDNGPPITEIVEELDEEGNVLSFRLNRPGEVLPRVKAALEKAGIDSPSLASSSKPQQDSGSANLSQNQSTKKVKESLPLPAEPEPAQEVIPPVSRMAQRVDGIMKTAKEQEKISSQPAMIPKDEDPDDAALRQQMLKYSMGEMGAVVAELNLEEDDDDDDDDDFDDEEWLEGDEIDDDDDDEEEDKYGRFTGRMITDKYQRRMLELETKLGVKSRFTQKLEQEAEERDSDDDDGEGIGRIRIQSQPNAPSVSASAAPTRSIVKERSSSEKGPKKGVRFANELDIAEAEPSSTLTESKSDSTSVVEPMSDLIVERKPTSKPTATPPAQRPSRFKKAVAGAQTSPGIPKGPFDVPASFLSKHEREERPVPTGPEGKTIADTLVEKGSVSRPADPSELDDDMVHMGVAEEHQRLRSRFIRRDGEGFLKEQEGPVQPLDETEGGSERVSRFKAARLSRQ
ncbi:udp-galactose transporter like protein [Cordyceps javanica]|uniref:Udp-galactose transporter like protein n=1 Tax=Cordyceps javanica TaxID=43265 RepID=A0A545V314_9HYPO|nr:udp-galactose transporter like protein [Cordyceps javanica]TQW07397.1 prefoldin subunit [Cordyceps javanica]